jgi:type III secretion protein V
MNSKLLSLLQRLPRSPELVLAFILILTVAMIVLPMPLIIVDTLLGLSLGLAILILMIAIHLDTPVAFSTLPGIIVITTVFRLSLAITTTRLILSEGDAGSIIRTFGEFVVAGSVVVGLVVFLIITVVQFIVIAKGGERVAEVAARFTLDAMPGKQMSIDAELRNGDIDHLEARRRRGLLERESQLFGAMDGAMKFVKGDAIAGLIIIVVNLIGGITIGVTQRDFTFAQAMAEYSLLTVGDGLIAQIPALFTSISAAIFVTKVGGDAGTNLGGDIMAQLMGNSTALTLAAAVLFGMGFVPGFPFPIFALLSAVMAAGAWNMHRKNSKQEQKTADEKPVDEKADTLAADPSQGGAPLTRPTALITLALNPGLVEKVGWPVLKDRMTEAHRVVVQELGVNIDPIAAWANAEVGEQKFQFDLDEVPLTEGDVDTNLVLLRDDPAHLELAGIPGNIVSTDADGVSIIGIEATFAEQLTAVGVGFADVGRQLQDHAVTTMKRNMLSLVGFKEARSILAEVQANHPELAEQVGGMLSIQKMAEVFKRLVDEGVSIKNSRLVFQALHEWAPREENSVLLAEYVRSSLNRQICYAHANVQKVISSYVMERDLETLVRQSLRESTAGIFLTLSDRDSERLLKLVRSAIGQVPAGQKRPILLCSMDIRRYVRNFLIRNGIDMAVLSYQDLALEFNILTAGSIGWGTAARQTRPELQPAE